MITPNRLAKDRAAVKETISNVYGPNSDTLRDIAFKGPLLTRSFLDYSRLEVNADDTLLSDRFLCRKGSLVFFGPAGQGKSSLVVQACSHWSVGLPFFGITSNLTSPERNR